jgi:hypothetical protein
MKKMGNITENLLSTKEMEKQEADFLVAFLNRCML